MEELICEENYEALESYILKPDWVQLQKKCSSKVESSPQPWSVNDKYSVNNYISITASDYGYRIHY